MKCLYCAASTRVTNSRSGKKKSTIWRRRQCLGCGAVFTTNEFPDLEKNLALETKNGKLQSFNRDRLLLSIAKACGHRKDVPIVAPALTLTVIDKLLLLADNGKVAKAQLILTTARVLTRFDKAAGVQYEAYHPL